MTERVQKTLEFLREQFENSAYFKDRPADRAYRYEHSIRVARIGAAIARAEGMDEEALAVACLLHDVYYCETFPEDYDWKDHGRDGAGVARPFVERLGFTDDVAEDICYGIAIHVDDKADFEGRRTPFTLTVGDADNIDRFDVCRIYDNLCWKDFYHMTLEERLDWLEGLIPRLEKLRREEFATPTATAMWREKVEYQLDFYRRLLEQMKAGSETGSEVPLKPSILGGL